MRFNSPTGKAILSLVREGDYAHPGEEAAIKLLFCGIDKNPDRSVLDLGCGRGGTAAYVQRHGWGRVTGVDIDGETLAYAADRYPGVSFVATDVGKIGELWRDHFDLIYLYNSFYAFPNQQQALQQMGQVARPGGTLAIFEYTDLEGRFREFANEENGFWQPIKLGEFPAQLRRAGWELERIEDMTARYLAWYRTLCSRIVSNRKRVAGEFGQEWYELALKTYDDLLALIESGVVGGAVVWARRL